MHVYIVRKEHVRVSTIAHSTELMNAQTIALRLNQAKNRKEQCRGFYLFTESRRVQVYIGFCVQPDSTSQ